MTVDNCLGVYEKLKRPSDVEVRLEDLKTCSSSTLNSDSNSTLHPCSSPNLPSTLNHAVGEESNEKESEFWNHCKIFL